MWRLTSREQEILLRIGRAVRGKQIACELGISEYTVRKHRASIMRKLGLQSAAQLISFAVTASTGSIARRAVPGSLCPREQEVLVLLVAGQTSKQIARKLSISPLTVRKHRQNIMRKRAVHSLAELIDSARPYCSDTPSEEYRTHST